MLMIVGDLDTIRYLCELESRNLSSIRNSLLNQGKNYTNGSRNEMFQSNTFYRRERDLTFDF